MIKLIIIIIKNILGRSIMRGNMRSSMFSTNLIDNIPIDMVSGIMRSGISSNALIDMICGNIIRSNVFSNALMDMTSVHSMATSILRSNITGNALMDMISVHSMATNILRSNITSNALIDMIVLRPPKIVFRKDIVKLISKMLWTANSRKAGEIVRPVHGVLVLCSSIRIKLSSVKLGQLHIVVFKMRNRVSNISIDGGKRHIVVAVTAITVGKVGSLRVRPVHRGPALCSGIRNNLSSVRSAHGGLVLCSGIRINLCRVQLRQQRLVVFDMRNRVSSGSIDRRETHHCQKEETRHRHCRCNHSRQGRFCSGQA